MKLANIMKEVDNLFKATVLSDDELERELTEFNTSAATPGYLTPNAFSDGSEKAKKYTKKRAEQSGMKVVDDWDINKNQSTHKTYSISPIDTSIIEEVLQELNYNEYRKGTNDEAKQKLNTAIQEINKKLYEIERQINMNVKLKKEFKLNDKSYMADTKRKIYKIRERLTRIGTQLNNFVE